MTFPQANPPPVRMHENEVDTGADLVRRLLAAQCPRSQSQFPQWADLPLTPVRSAGTDNAVYRLGDALSVRLPRIGWAVDQVEKEHAWLPRLAPHLPLAVPEPVFRGEPGEGFPYPWAVHRWLEGENLNADTLADPEAAARDLARFVLALRHLPTPPDAPRAGRGQPLATRDEGVREAVAALGDLIDGKAALTAWERALRAPEWKDAPVWVHGDLSPGNLLFQSGRLSAVIDFGGLGVGDPACDLMPAWSLFSAGGREVFRAALAADVPLAVGEALWERGRGHALAQALMFIPYYLHTNPVGVRGARQVVAQVLADEKSRS
ncbi:aminoglycoside phosphotransferase family protein [Deinococcus altitudinis]|uniref:aminoglycoside phosphotransferase family protein n=1 Tax=Deinococcus altitudinis TaxID=468914 RepID=UPI0038913311